MECSRLRGCLYGFLPLLAALRKVFQAQGLGSDFGSKPLILKARPVRS